MAYRLQHAEMVLVEVPKAANASVERDRDEVERAERPEIPLHVRQDKVPRFGRGVAEEDFLDFGGTVEDVLYPEGAGSSIGL